MYCAWRTPRLCFGQECLGVEFGVSDFQVSLGKLADSLASDFTGLVGLNLGLLPLIWLRAPHHDLWLKLSFFVGLRIALG